MQAGERPTLAVLLERAQTTGEALSRQISDQR
jgi:hypothetical protein